MSTYEIRFVADYPPTWDLYRDGLFVSEHATHEAARAALAAIPPRDTCAICGNGFEAEPGDKHRHATGEFVHTTCFARLDAS